MNEQDIKKIISELNSRKSEFKDKIITVLINDLNEAVEKASSNELKTAIAKLAQAAEPYKLVMPDLVWKGVVQERAAQAGAEPKKRVIVNPTWKSGGPKEIVEGFINNFEKEHKKLGNNLTAVLQLLNAKESHGLFASINTNYAAIVKKHQTMGTKEFTKRDIDNILLKMRAISHSLQHSEDILNGLFRQAIKDKKINKENVMMIQAVISVIPRLRDTVDKHHKELALLVAYK